MTTLLKSTNSSGVTTLKTSFLGSLVIAVFLLVNVSNMLICFEDFSSCRELNLIGAEDAD